MLYAVEQGIKEGLIDGEGRVRLPFEYDRLDRTDQDGLIGALVDARWGLLSCDGHWVRQPFCDGVGDLSDNRCVYQFHDAGTYLSGYLNYQGEKVTEAVWESAGAYACGRSIVTRGDRRLCIDRDGVMVFDCSRYDHVVRFIDDRARADLGPIDKFHNIMLDLDGHEVVPADGYQYISFFRQGRAVVQPYERPGRLIDRDNQTIFQLDADSPLKFEGYDSSLIYAVHRQSGDAGFLDTEGKVAIPLKSWEAAHTYVQGFCDGRLAMRDHQTNLEGYIDQHGEWVIPAGYHIACNFECGRAAVMPSARERWGLIDTEGNTVVSPTYKQLEHVGDGVWCGDVDHRTDMIRDDGAVIWSWNR